MKIALINEENPKIHQDVLLITGDGMSLPTDLKVFGEICQEHDTFCLGRSYRLIQGHVDHWGDVDGEVSVNWAENLKVNWRNGPQRHTLGEMRGFDYFWNIEHSFYAMEDIMWHGSTALFATVIAYKMGYKAVILAGCPLDSKGHWYFAGQDDNVGPRWPGETYMAWLDFIGSNPNALRTRSLSGYTKTMLGGVTIEWLKFILQR